MSRIVNDTMHQYASPDLPIGRIGQSGKGRYLVEANFETFSLQKSVARRPTRVDLLCGIHLIKISG